MPSKQPVVYVELDPSKALTLAIAALEVAKLAIRALPEWETEKKLALRRRVKKLRKEILDEVHARVQEQLDKFKQGGPNHGSRSSSSSSRSRKPSPRSRRPRRPDQEDVRLAEDQDGVDPPGPEFE